MKTWNIIYREQEDLYALRNNFSEVQEQSLLIQIFTAVHDKTQIQQLIHDILMIFPKALIIGTTTKAPISEGHIYEDACVVSLTYFENTQLSLYTYEKKEVIKEEMIGSQIGMRLNKGNEKVAIIFAYGNSFNYEGFLEGFSLKQPDIIVAGGIATENQSHESFVFSHEGIVNEGFVMIVLENKQLIVHSDHTLGWVPIGRKYEVTKVSGNKIQEIDHIAAKTWYQKYIGYESILGEEVGFLFPIMVERQGIYVSKTVTGFTEDGEILLKGSVKVGDKIRLGYRDYNEAILNIKELYKKMQNFSIESLFAYSCVSRQSYLTELAEIEFLPFKEQVPVVGFRSLGEFINNKQQNILVSKALSFLALSEGKEKNITLDLSIFDTLLSYDEQVILSHLIKSTNEELDLFNDSLELIVQEQTHQLKAFYYTDELTQLSNSNKFNRDLARHRFSKVALFDIEDFTVINNFYGSQVGNYILKEFADYLKNELQNYGLEVYRIQSDTFAVAGDEAMTDEAFTCIIKELQITLNRKSFSANIHEIYLSVLTVIAIREKPLLEKALLTLDYLKFKKKSFQIYHPLLKIEEELGKNLKWIKKLKEAIQQDRIVPYFQPIYNNKTKRIDKYEALIRLIDEDGTVVSPYHFLHIAKQTNIYSVLTRIMVEKTFAAFEEKPYEFSINLTVDDMLDSSTRQHIIYHLSNFKHPQKVIFEIVETEKIDNYSEIKTFINSVKAYGAQIAIDDFGTGYSNLTYLVQLQVDMIKVDGSIIKNIILDETSNLVAKAILDLAKGLGVKTVAEYVENEEIYNQVVALDMDYSQGYYFSKPVERIF